VATGELRTATTGEAAHYALGVLRPGVYTASVAHDGFKQFTQEGVLVPTGERIRLDVALVVGGPHETVRVSADAPRLRSESGRLSHVVPQRAIEALP
jgi:hypothetical protein